ncbi:MAG: YmdB family metallophosphoesterase [Mycoplasmataceae bacterium]|nr:YmdB family metallophosphoesterase [Mycoplasmataceae bacterium]
MKNLNILFIGDIFGKPGIEKVEQELSNLKKEHAIDFVIAQSENVSGRKGFIEKDYLKLSQIGVNAFTLGNHVWAKKEIESIINNNNIIRPLNIEDHYPGSGSNVFDINGIKLRITSLMGITFNKLLTPWKEDYANSFFDAIDNVIESDESDFHLIDFHAETTSEKNVLAAYLDGKVDALIGTHTHVQTNDAKIFENNLAFVSDAGMTGPSNCAIGANFKEVYEKMRFNSFSKFKISNNVTQFNGVVVKLNKKGSSIKLVNFI